ncbi:MAG: pentapeptide repeat-containing protein [bacterium]|nr:pentapeptide repeat-containing protein [bacterium]
MSRNEALDVSTMYELARMLREDIAGWNAWREANRGVHFMLEGWHFGPFDPLSHGPRELMGIDLQGANLSSIGFEKVLFCGANLSGVDLSYSTLMECRLNETNSRNANFMGATLWEVDFQRADMWLTNLKSTKLHVVSFVEADLRGASFESTTLEVAIDFLGANLWNARFEGADLRGARNFPRALFDTWLRELRGQITFVD